MVFVLTWNSRNRLADPRDPTRKFRGQPANSRIQIQNLRAKASLSKIMKTLIYGTPVTAAASLREIASTNSDGAGRQVGDRLSGSCIHAHQILFHGRI